MEGVKSVDSAESLRVVSNSEFGVRNSELGIGSRPGSESRPEPVNSEFRTANSEFRTRNLKGHGREEAILAGTGVDRAAAAAGRRHGLAQGQQRDPRRQSPHPGQDRRLHGQSR